jgi:diguanylate cyclase (GGDEF)-like protein
MNDSISILLALLVVSNVVLVAFVVTPSILRRRREHRFADSLLPVGSSVSPPESIDDPATTLGDDNPAPAATDALAELLLPPEWERILGREDARVRRYGRPATIVLIELDGLDRLAGALGQDAGDRLIVAVAEMLSSHKRGADQLARLDVGRFGVLLPETGEVEAVNYVERVRSVCDLWLEAGAIALRLAIGWAAPPVGGTLGDALAVAEERLHAEQRRSNAPVTPAPAPAPATQATDLTGRPTPARDSIAAVP